MTRRTLIGAATVLVVAVLGGMLGTVVAPPEPSGPWTVHTIVQPAVGRLPGSGSDMAESTVRIGVTGAAIAANALAILEGASSAPDPQFHAESLLTAGGLGAPDDQCVVPGGEPRGDCPAGLNATVVTEPSVRIQSAAVATPGSCDTAEGEIAITVLTDVPAAVTASWWADGVAVQERTADSGECIVLGELLSETLYTVHVRAGDDWRRFAFDSSGAATRPGATVYTPTDDLVAVTVPHRPGERVDVFPNVLNGDEPRCDEVQTGYDVAVHELGRVTGSVDAEVLAAASLDEAFTERTTVGYDIGEGLTVFLCVVVTAADGTEDYTAQTIVETADRLVPELAVTAVEGRDLPGWGLTAWLPSGQRCGSWHPGTPATSREVSLRVESEQLCDTTDPAGLAGAEPPEGRGVLPFSAGDHATLTVNLDYPQVGPSYTTLALGPIALCTGACLPPRRPSFYVVQGALGTATLMLYWTQGSSNGAPRTDVGPVSDSVGVPSPGPQLDVGTSIIRLNGNDAEPRSATADLVVRADRDASYTARLVPAADETACERPGAVLELAGQLEPEPFTVPTFLQFSGLCRDTDYQVIVELTDGDGLTTVWGPPGSLTKWGSASRVSVPALETTASVSVQVSGSAGPAVYLTLRVDGTTIVGPRWGGCPGVGFAGGPSELVVLPIGETTRFSGVIELPNASPGPVPSEPCVPFWGTGRRGIPFDLELSWDELMGGPRGVPIELSIVDQGVRGLDGTATVVAIISIIPG
jgi:hypothetical protein